PPDHVPRWEDEQVGDAALLPVEADRVGVVGGGGGRGQQQGGERGGREPAGGRRAGPARGGVGHGSPGGWRSDEQVLADVLPELAVALPLGLVEQLVEGRLVREVRVPGGV